MAPIVECVPNFSEGRDLKIIDEICEQIKSVEGVLLLDVDPGKDTNRTVVTFAGSPQGVAEAAFQAIKKAAELIDMSKHKGAHPRMGATDVCPFVPVSDISMEECVELSKRVARRVGEELGIPVYLYEESASNEKRRSLAYLRDGEYEALEQKLKSEEFKPDFGPAQFNARSGATVIGARQFLIAYNVNLNTRNVKIAKEIAFKIREAGRTVKNPQTGEKETIPGTLKAVRAIGWYIPEYQRAQISINLLNYKITPLYRVFEEVEKFASEFGVRVTGSELVGLIPKDALLETGKYYLNKQNGFKGLAEEDILLIAVQSLGLSEISRFEIEHKVIEYRFKKPEKLCAMNLKAFVKELASDSPAPGGGSVSALCGALSAALASMVSALTFGKKGYENYWEKLSELAAKAQQLQQFFVEAIDLDTEAFNSIMNAFALPKKTAEETSLRNQSILAATKEATLIPFSVLEKSLETVKIIEDVLLHGNQNSLSDAAVAVLMAEAAAQGAYYNVYINTKEIADNEFKEKIRSQADQILADILLLAKKLKAEAHQRLS